MKIDISENFIVEFSSLEEEMAKAEDVLFSFFKMVCDEENRTGMNR